MRRIRDEFTAKSIRDEVFVEGNTFHEYSTATNSRILDYTISNSLARKKRLTVRGRTGLVVSTRKFPRLQQRLPRKQRQLLGVPRVKLVMQRACTSHSNKIAREQVSQLWLHWGVRGGTSQSFGKTHNRVSQAMLQEVFVGYLIALIIVVNEPRRSDKPSVQEKNNKDEGGWREVPLQMACLRRSLPEQSAS
jgi:hypothetical protein